MPYVVMWVLFSYIYIFMPNTKVQMRSGIIGGIVGGTIYQFVQFAYITFQIGASKAGAIYGSFAALPLFLVWLQFSWLVVLFGAEISFAKQNVGNYEYEPDSLKASLSLKQLAALSITQVCVKRFHLAEDPLTAAEISHDLEMPIRLVQEVLFHLTEAGVLSEARLNDENQAVYQPARDIDKLTILCVLDLLNQTGVTDIPFAETKDVKKIKTSLESIINLHKQSPENLILKDI